MKPGRKKSKDPKCRLARVRLSVREYNRVKTLATIYAGGSISKWLRHAALNADRKLLK